MGGKSTLRRAKAITLGMLLVEPEEQASADPEPARQPLPTHWQPPWDSGGGLERSELGNEITAEVRRWLLGETTGQQVSQVVLDRSLTVLSNFKLASGCNLEILGGPLGAIIGGYSDADWLYEEVFRKQPAEALQDAFALLNFKPLPGGDWSGVVAEEVSLAYRRQCLRQHPSRGGSPRTYLKLQVAMELVRAFSGEAGPLKADLEEDNVFVLNDTSLAKELQLTAKEAEAEAANLKPEQLEEMNRALDEYILRQMCFKSEIVDEIARLHEDSAYAILGISSGATDSEIKKAYRIVAMQCHPDKGGDKEEFQELNSAYERIMEMRREFNKNKPAASNKESHEGEGDGETAKKPADGETPVFGGGGEDADGEGGQEATKGDGADGKGTDGAASNGGGEASFASVVEKAGKAAEEASRYAKTAAECSHQAADAAEAARQGKEQGDDNSLIKSTAHSAIVLTLTVVKAVRIVGYATLDVAAQCRDATKRNAAATECSEKSVSAMSLGLEALNAALACAEVTETTAAELQGEPEGGSSEGGSSEAAEVYVGAAVRASLAAASASSAAMSAAIAAVEGSRRCMQAMSETGSKPEDEEKEEEGEGEKAEEDKKSEAKEETEERPEPPKRPSAEEMAERASKRLVSQRHNNHKVLQRLNSEILGHQRNVRMFLQQNRQLIPAVTCEAKQKVVSLLQDYAQEARAELEGALRGEKRRGHPDGEEVLQALRAIPMLVPFLQPQHVAIPVSVKARVLKMASLYDFSLAMKVVEAEIFGPAREALPKDDAAALNSVNALLESIRNEICSNVAEEAPEQGGATPTTAAGESPTCV